MCSTTTNATYEGDENDEEQLEILIAISVLARHLANKLKSQLPKKEEK